MSSTVLHALHIIESDKHAVGNLNNWNVELLNQGAVALERLENYSIVELGWQADGDQERTMKYLTDESKKGYLVCAVEDYMSEYGETISNFFIEEGERGRVVRQHETLRFDVSNYELTDPSKEDELKNGTPAYWNVAKKKFVICNNGPDANYANAGNKYVVAFSDGLVLGGQKIIRLEIDNEN